MDERLEERTNYAAGALGQSHAMLLQFMGYRAVGEELLCVAEETGLVRSLNTLCDLEIQINKDEMARYRAIMEGRLPVQHRKDIAAAMQREQCELKLYETLRSLGVPETKAREFSTSPEQLIFDLYDRLCERYYGLKNDPGRNDLL